MSIANNIREERERQGMTQSDLAKACGLQPAAINHFERGRRVPSVKNLIKIARALYVSLDELCEITRP
jgi:transcriptional regulator with XRE-family HTH domain